MTQGEILLRAITDDPFDPAPRYAYADWLQENGEVHRAEMITTFLAYAADHRMRGPGAGYPDDEVSVRESLAAVVAAMGSLMEVDEQWQEDEPWTMFDSVEGHRAVFRGGFIEEVAVTESEWRLAGPAIVRANPIIYVNLIDRFIGRDATGQPTIWVRTLETPPNFLAAIREEFFYQIAPPNHRYPLVFSTSQDGTDEMSRALIMWARHSAGMPPLPATADRYWEFDDSELEPPDEDPDPQPPLDEDGYREWVADNRYWNRERFGRVDFDVPWDEFAGGVD